MSTVKELRETLGFTQEQMGNYLGVSRVQLAMAEVNQRSLSTQALVRWGFLEQSLSANQLTPSAKAAVATNKRVQANNKLLQQKLKQYNWELSNLQYQLINMQQRYQQCNKAFHAVAFLRSKPAHVVLSELDIASLNLLEQQTLMQLDKCDIDAQGLLQHRIKVLAFEVEELGKLLAV